FQRRLAVRHARATKPIRSSEYSAKRVRWMNDRRAVERIVVINPPNQSTDIECGMRGIEHVRGSGHARAMLDGGARHQRPEQLGARRQAQRLETAAEAVDQTVMRGLECKHAFDRVMLNVIRDIGNDLVENGT